MVSSPDGRTARELVRRVEAEADHGDARLLEQRQQPCADAHRVLDRVLAVLAFLPHPAQRGVPHDHRRVDPNTVGPQGDQPPRGLEVLVLRVSRQAGHHLQNEFKAVCADEARGALHIRRRMPAPRKAQDFLVHGLSPELDRLHAEGPQAIQYGFVNGVGAGGQADRVDQAAFHRLPRRAQQRLLLGYRDRREAAPIKRQLPLLSPGEKGGIGYSVPHVLRAGGTKLSGDPVLVAEHAGVGAPEMRHKNRNNARAGAHSERLSSALRAAICSASFLVRPLPDPAATPLMRTSKVKRLSWSGPDSSAST